METRIWADLPLVIQRIAAAVALDISMPLVSDYIAGHRDYPFLRNDISFMEEWIRLLLNNPNKSQARTQKRRLLSRWHSGIFDRWNQIFSSYESPTRTDAHLIFQAFSDSIVEHEEGGQLSEIVAFCVAGLSGFASSQGFSVCTRQYGTISCRYLPREGYILNIPVDGLVARARQWIGIWWQEVKNVLPFVVWPKFIK